MVKRRIPYEQTIAQSFHMDMLTGHGLWKSPAGSRPAPARNVAHALSASALI